MQNNIVTRRKSHILIVDVANTAIDISLCAKDVPVDESCDRHAVLPSGDLDRVQETCVN